MSAPHGHTPPPYRLDLAFFTRPFSQFRSTCKLHMIDFDQDFDINNSNSFLQITVVRVNGQ